MWLAWKLEPAVLFQTVACACWLYSHPLALNASDPSSIICTIMLALPTNATAGPSRERQSASPVDDVAEEEDEDDEDEDEAQAEKGQGCQGQGGCRERVPVLGRDRSDGTSAPK